MTDRELYLMGFTYAEMPHLKAEAASAGVPVDFYATWAMWERNSRNMRLLREFLGELEATRRLHVRSTRQRTTRGQNAQRRANLKRLEG